MVKRTLDNTKKATFQVMVPHPDPEAKGFPIPYGTGFFISPDGHFITAAHVLRYPSGAEIDLSQIYITQPRIPQDLEYRYLSLIGLWKNFDIALLRVEKKSNLGVLEREGLVSFNNIQPDFNVIQEGEQVYSFGYPLSEQTLQVSGPVMIGTHTHYPRATSLMISSHHESMGMLRRGPGPPTHYIVDKALNYGNSGGPIIVTCTGMAISVVSSFQPVEIPQREGRPRVMVPSLYGVTSSLKNIEDELKSEIDYLM